MITIGTKVAIMPGADYTGRFIGEIGIVKKNYKGRIGVYIHGYVNPENKDGMFWFEEQSLAIIPDASAFTDDAIHQVIFSGSKTIVVWKDGTKTMVSCFEGDQYDRYAGFCAAIAKRIYGSTSNIKKTINRYTRKDK